MSKFQNYKFRASQISKIMVTAKGGEVLSVGAKTYLNEIYEDSIFGEAPEVDTIEMQKGNLLESDAIRLLSKARNNFYQKHPEDKKLENEYIQGHPDILDVSDQEVIDIKIPFRVRKWFRYTEKDALDNYYWQLLSYMWMAGYQKATIAVCAMPTPDDLIQRDAQKEGFSYKANELSPEKFEEEYQKFLNLHNFAVIQEKDRIKFFNVPYNQEDIDRIISKVESAREYLMQLESSESLSLAVQKSATQSFVSTLGTGLSEIDKIISKYKEFGIELSFVEKIEGASIIQYRFQPIKKGVKIEKASYYSKDIQALFESDNIRILTPIAGTGLIGIEFVKDKKDVLKLETVPKLEGAKFSIGRTVENKDYIIDFNESTTPHMIVAGTTGSGKTVFLNSMLNQLEANTDPKKLKTIIIDPKNEFSDRKFKNGFAIERISEIESLLDNIINNMDHRYGRVIEDEFEIYEEDKILIVVEELADLLGHKEKKEVSVKTESKDKIVNGVVIEMDKFSIKQIPLSEVIQNQIQRIAQKGRAAGIHLVICTQNPLSKEIGSTLKANLPVSVSFRVKTETNSKVVLDFAGAEKLTGNGDGLIIDSKQKEPLRFQSYYTA